MSNKFENQAQWNEYWLQQWSMKNINFHQDQIEPFLQRYLPEIEKTTVLMPLCGKSKDILFFTQKGHSVIGIEISEAACDTFFLENGIKFSRENIENFIVYRSDSITIYCGDFFNVKPEFMSSVSIVYDRAALIALPKETRKIYVQHLLKLLGHGTKNKMIFLISLEYVSEQRRGPPFSVDRDEVQSLYGASFDVQELDTEEDVGITKTHEGFQSSAVFERVYLLKRE